MQKHIQHNKDERTQFFRKIYLSVYWKGCVWEGVGDWTELLHIDPFSYGHNSVSFLFSWAASRGRGGPASAGKLFSFQHLLSNSSEALKSNCSIGGPEGPHCWVLVFYTASFFQLTRTSSVPSYIIVLRPLNSICRQSRLSPDILDWMHQLFTQVHFLFWQLDWVGGQYTTTPPGYETKPGSSPGSLRNVEYPFIAASPRFTLTRSGYKDKISVY